MVRRAKPKNQLRASSHIERTHGKWQPNLQ
jgi:hypothetical protein